MTKEENKMKKLYKQALVGKYAEKIAARIMAAEDPAIALNTVRRVKEDWQASTIRPVRGGIKGFRIVHKPCQACQRYFVPGEGCEDCPFQLGRGCCTRRLMSLTRTYSVKADSILVAGSLSTARRTRGAIVRVMARAIHLVRERIGMED